MGAKTLKQNKTAYFAQNLMPKHFLSFLLSPSGMFGNELIHDSAILRS